MKATLSYIRNIRMLALESLRPDVYTGFSRSNFTII